MNEDSYCFHPGKPQIYVYHKYLETSHGPKCGAKCMPLIRMNTMPQNRKSCKICFSKAEYKRQLAKKRKYANKGNYWNEEKGKWEEISLT